MNRYPTILAICLAVLVPAVSWESTARAEQSDHFMQGIWKIRYIIQDPHEYLIPVEVKTNVYSQVYQPVHRGYILTVTIRAESPGVTIPFSLNADVVPEMYRDPVLIKDLGGASTRDMAFRRLMAWVDRVARYDGNAELLQDSEEVLRRGTANCVGRCTLLQELGNSMGIPCRSISGILWDGDDARFHRWIEVDFGAAGSFPSEPGDSQNYVDPYHIIMAVSENVPPDTESLSQLDVQIQKVEESRRFFAVDKAGTGNPGEPGIRRLKMNRLRYGGAVAGYARKSPGTDIRVTLNMGANIHRTVADEFGNFSFLDLEPDSYTLVIEPSRGNPVHLTGTLASRQLAVHEYTIRPEGLVR